MTKPLDRDSVARQIAATPGGLMLESIERHLEWGRFSYYGVAAESRPSEVEDPFDQLARRLRPFAPFAEAPPLPFVGGWIGWLGYESGRFIEPFKRRHNSMPDVPSAHWWACDSLLVHAHETDEWFVAGCELLQLDGRPPLAARLNALEHWALDGCQHAPQFAPLVLGEMKSNMTRGQYDAAIAACLEYIRAGDIYQVNFAQRFAASMKGDPWLLYDRLCRCNPAMFAAYLPWDRDMHDTPHSAVLSSSPELFLELRGRHVVTRPIKGTRPRIGDAVMDAAAAVELESSEKERAELTMIVDLERNDLGRVCEYGSVRVTCTGMTEPHPTVLHRVAQVEGVLREDCDAIDLLQATYPGGSITGAPKVRAMQIIDELEPHPRGPYCGAIGWIGVDGAMLLNIAIRTMLVSRGQAYLWAGGGIVADSDADAEYAETLAKAEGMRRAMEICYSESESSSSSAGE